MEGATVGGCLENSARRQSFDTQAFIQLAPITSPGPEEVQHRTGYALVLLVVVDGSQERPETFLESHSVGSFASLQKG